MSVKYPGTINITILGDQIFELDEMLSVSLKNPVGVVIGDGEGIVTIGEIFVRIAAFSGLEVYTFRTYPAEILGGHVTFQARIADTLKWFTGLRRQVRN